MFESIINFFKKIGKSEKDQVKSKDAAKERLHLVLMQDRANVSADFLDLMKQEIIEVIKKYIDVDENAIDVRLTNKANGDGTTGAPALYANIPIVSIKDEVKSGMAREKKVEKELTTNTKKATVNKTEAKKEDKTQNKTVEPDNSVSTTESKEQKVENKTEKKEGLKTDNKKEDKKVENKTIEKDDAPVSSIENKEEIKKEEEKNVEDIASEPIEEKTENETMEVNNSANPKENKEESVADKTEVKNS